MKQNLRKVFSNQDCPLYELVITYSPFLCAVYIWMNLGNGDQTLPNLEAHDLILNY